jgi:hypothetical protein
MKKKTENKDAVIRRPQMFQMAVTAEEIKVLEQYRSNLSKEMEGAPLRKRGKEIADLIPPCPGYLNVVLKDNCRKASGDGKVENIGIHLVTGTHAILESVNFGERYVLETDECFETITLEEIGKYLNLADADEKGAE